MSTCPRCEKSLVWNESCGAEHNARREHYARAAQLPMSQLVSEIARHIVECHTGRSHALTCTPLEIEVISTELDDRWRRVTDLEDTVRTQGYDLGDLKSDRGGR